MGTLEVSGKFSLVHPGNKIIVMVETGASFARLLRRRRIMELHSKGERKEKCLTILKT